MGSDKVFAAKVACLKAEFGTDEYEAVHDAYLHALIDSGKTELESAQISYRDSLLGNSIVSTLEEANSIARIDMTAVQSDIKKNNSFWCTSEGQRQDLEFCNEDLIRAIASAGLLTNTGDDLIIYEYKNVRVITRSGEYMLQRRIDLIKRKNDTKWVAASFQFDFPNSQISNASQMELVASLKNLNKDIKQRETSFWSTFYDSRVLSVLNDYENLAYTETRKKIDIDEMENYAKLHHKKRIDVIKLAKEIGVVVFKQCEDCGYSFSVRGMQERFCNMCKEKRARKRVREYRDKKKKPEKEFIRDDDRRILSPNMGLIRCMNPGCGRLFPGVRAKYCPACKVAEWRKKKKKID